MKSFISLGDLNKGCELLPVSKVPENKVWFCFIFWSSDAECWLCSVPGTLSPMIHTKTLFCFPYLFICIYPPYCPSIPIYPAVILLIYLMCIWCVCLGKYMHVFLMHLNGILLSMIISTITFIIKYYVLRTFIFVCVPLIQDFRTQHFIHSISWCALTFFSFLPFQQCSLWLPQAPYYYKYPCCEPWCICLKTCVRIS